MVSTEVLGTNVDVDIVLVQEVHGQLLDLLGPGRGPHENLVDAYKNKTIKIQA